MAAAYMVIMSLDYQALFINSKMTRLPDVSFRISISNIYSFAVSLGFIWSLGSTQ